MQNPSHPQTHVIVHPGITHTSTPRPSLPLPIQIHTLNNPGPLVGNPAPEFEATAVFDQEFTDITLSQYKGKYVVLFFYPLDFTFVCPTEITAFSDRHQEFADLNTEVGGC